MKKAIIFDATHTDEGKALIRKSGMKVANNTQEATGFYHGVTVPVSIAKGLVAYALGDYKPADEQDIVDIYGVIDGELVCLGVVD